MPTQDWPAAQSRARPAQSGRAQVSVAFFSVLLVATLVAPVVMGSAPLPGLALVCFGMVLLGIAELSDAGSRRFVIALRLGGIAVALLGLVLQIL